MVRAVIEAALGSAFRPSQDTEPAPALAAGTTKVFFHDEHPFEDDAGFPASRYRYGVSVEDSARDEERQLAVARQVFDAVKAQGWRCSPTGSRAAWPSLPEERRTWRHRCRDLADATMISVRAGFSIAGLP